MSSGQPRISQLYSWNAHAERVKRVLRVALDLLPQEVAKRQNPISVDSEPTLSFILLQCIRVANAQLSEVGQGVPHPIVCEAQNQPQPEDQRKDPRLLKRPDFLWGMIDATESDPQRRDRFYTIECKCLGQHYRADRVFNRFYVQNGILRFVSEEYGYAKWDSEGAMVGYVQSMDFDDILKEVNSAASDLQITPLPTPRRGWAVGGTSLIIQTVYRPWSVGTFTLHHHWIDLKSCYTRTGRKGARGENETLF